MDNINKVIKKRINFWISLGATFVLAIITILTSTMIYNSRNRSVSPVAPLQPGATGNCILSYSIPTPTPCLEDIDIVGISIDRSASMNDLEPDGRTKLEWAKEAATVLVSRLQSTESTSVKVAVNSFGGQGNDGTGVLDSTFNSTLHVGLTSDFNSVLSAIAKIGYVKWNTCVQCGIRLSNNQVNTNDSAKKVAILLSDGRTNTDWSGTDYGEGDTLARAAAINEANDGRSKGVQYHVIGYGDSQGGSPVDETTLRGVAGTNGTYQYKPNPQDWSSAFLQILDNICQSGPTPTSTVTPTPSLVGQCTDVRIYNSNWTALTSTQISALKPGDQIKFCVRGSVVPVSGSFDRARFTINNVLYSDTTLLRPGTTNEFCQNYTLPESVYSFKAKGEIHHTTLGWL